LPIGRQGFQRTDFTVARMALPEILTSAGETT
jgi:hypothetical protein